MVALSFLSTCLPELGYETQLSCDVAVCGLVSTVVSKLTVVNVASCKVVALLALVVSVPSVPSMADVMVVDSLADSGVDVSEMLVGIGDEVITTSEQP